METFKVYRWDTGEEIASIEAETFKAGIQRLIAKGICFYRADFADADFAGANFAGANFAGANFAEADFTRADFTRADFARANFARANFAGANFAEADFTRADFARADFARANFARAKGLEFFRNDLWSVLLHAIPEIDGLALALREGRVDGSCYEGECACLVGTIANVRHCKHTEIPGLRPDSSRPAEKWFMAIAKGDTPESSNVVKLTLEWIEEFQKLLPVQKVQVA